MTGTDDLRLPNEDDPELTALIDRYLMPGRRYLELLHANFWRLPDRERSAFIASLRADAAGITDHELSVLLSSEWRSRLTASWLVASSRRASFAGQLGSLLLASDMAYAGQGLCVALASIGDGAAADCLSVYLDRWLPETDCRYDQEWAMAALIWIDEVRVSSDAARFLVPGGLWESWRREQTDLERQMQLTRSVVEAITG